VRYLSIFFEIKDLDRTNSEAEAAANGSGYNFRNESQIGPAHAGLQTFGFPYGNRAVFNGEFDSGSERTLAAWIRHASRARFFLVAIQGKV
jgi:hypothetical protein